MIAHVAYCRRSDGHPGGVPKFGAYLERYLEARNFAWSDRPEPPFPTTYPEHDKAILFNAWLQSRGMICAGDRIVADGFWANGLPEEFDVVVVAHGTWAEISLRLGGVPRGFIEAQARAYQTRPVIAVSEGAARQVREHYGVEPEAVICNGVDLEEFAPSPYPEPPRLRPRVVHVGKGGGVLDQLRRMLPDWDVVFLDAGIGEEADKFRTADLFVHPSRSEGDAYAVIEALACGLPTVGSAVGRLEGMEGEREFGEVLGRDAGAQEYGDALRRVWRRREECRAGARAYAQAHADAERWAREWRAYLRQEVQ